MTQPGSCDGGTVLRRYQFQIDGRGFGARVHTEWSLAAQDAVAAADVAAAVAVTATASEAATVEAATAAVAPTSSGVAEGGGGGGGGGDWDGALLDLF